MTTTKLRYSDVTNSDESIRFEFGKNWKLFIAEIEERQLQAASLSLTQFLGRTRFEKVRFLDIGSGSGIFSLAAATLGASVLSFDYDPESVSCTELVRQEFSVHKTRWEIRRGSVLDDDFMGSLGHFNIVYAWGVLHHTGNMWKALDNACRAVDDNGQLYVALYNDQGWLSRYWHYVKQSYHRGIFSRLLVRALHYPYLVGARAIARLLTGRLRFERGMKLLTDTEDWLGGLPFEVARPEQVLDFCVARGFVLSKLRTCGGRHGCVEYLFDKNSSRES